MTFFRKKDGFTLIELLVVISVLAVLAGLVINVMNTQGFYSRSRDSQRIADLKKIQTALELYFSDNRCYPNSVRNATPGDCVGTGAWAIVESGTNLVSMLEPNYLNAVPLDPQHATGNADPCGNCPPSEHRTRYNYTTTPTGSAYVLTAIMELEASHEGHECTATNLNNWGDAGWGNTWCGTFECANYCYGVENP
jgi:prepilin-type N-terminal cleavage/methylation domain-containing protein